ncbi:hypothetical protein [Streptomyces sp. 3213.3]|uniref:hypothetical protein n=1 Tax=Streptomyces sp. 3213.3 TaxID=1855348 RepID=UPI0010420112|nr:hypothetical protein [Streptomyces sp. 3213.3]
MAEISSRTTSCPEFTTRPPRLPMAELPPSVRHRPARTAPPGTSTPADGSTGTVTHRASRTIDPQ